MSGSGSVHARAPMRISFGGGGTELSPYVEEHGGFVVSATLGIYAQCSLSPRDDSDLNVSLYSQETGESMLWPFDAPESELESVPNSLRLPAACLLFLQQQGFRLTQPLRLISGSEAPRGSGLGASSVLTVAILKALDEHLKLRWSPSELAHCAYLVERKLLRLYGGLQDQYSAAYGGVNSISFHPQGAVSVEPLRLSPAEIDHLESSLILLYTGQSRESAHIVEKQRQALNNNERVLNSFHELKAIASDVRIALQSGDMRELGKLLHESWILKSGTAEGISNDLIDTLYQRALDLGCYGGKISGAGGGGFLLLVVPSESRIGIGLQLQNPGNVLFPVRFDSRGARAWSP